MKTRDRIVQMPCFWNEQWSSDAWFFTQDADFLALVADRWKNADPFATVVYGHQLRTTIGKAISDLELIVQSLASDERQNQLIYLPL